MTNNLDYLDPDSPEYDAGHAEDLRYERRKQLEGDISMEEAEEECKYLSTEDFIDADFGWEEEDYDSHN